MFRYLALGDSITAGDNASSPALAYPSLVAAHLQKGARQACLSVLAHEGWTSGALTGNVLEDSPIPLHQANVITIWVGGNDLAFAGLRVLRGAPATTVETALEQYARHVGVLVTSIRSVSQARIVLCSQYNPFPHSAVAVQAVDSLNALTATAASRLKTGYAPVHAWFEGQQAELISGYRTGRVEDALKSPRLPVHPNDKGHRVIANGLSGLVGGK
ncbi:MAG: SGNH/GDSL hydrolase family protein [Tumebacillaceae bacterium]